MMREQLHVHKQTQVCTFLAAASRLAVTPHPLHRKVEKNRSSEDFHPSRRARPCCCLRGCVAEQRVDIALATQDRLRKSGRRGLQIIIISGYCQHCTTANKPAVRSELVVPILYSSPTHDKTQESGSTFMRVMCQHELDFALSNSKKTRRCLACPNLASQFVHDSLDLGPKKSTGDFFMYWVAVALFILTVVRQINKLVWRRLERGRQTSYGIT